MPHRAINELDAAMPPTPMATRGWRRLSLQYGVSTFSALNAIAGAYVEFQPGGGDQRTPGADARQITKMYDVLYHHSTGNLRADQEVFRQVTVASETLSTSVGAPEKIDNLLTPHHPQAAGLYRMLQGGVGRALSAARPARRCGRWCARANRSRSKTPSSWPGRRSRPRNVR